MIPTVRRLRLIAAVLLPFSALAQGAGARITAVRYWSLGDVTRVAIETDREVQFHSQRTDSPDRIFFDFPGLNRQEGKRGLETIPVGDKLLRQIRIALFQRGVTRVVLDLAGDAEYSVSQLADPFRIIVELRTPGHAPATPPLRSLTGVHTPEIPAPPDIVPQAAKPAETRPAPSPEPLPAAPVPVPAAVVAPPAAHVTVSTPAAAPAKPPRGEDATRRNEVASAARLDSRGDRSLIRALGLKLERVVLDPGHGGHDTGTIGPAGLAEKDLVLDVSKRLGELIRVRLGADIVYTRTDDTFVPLEERTEVANQSHADLFLSIHANSSRLRNIAGSETFYLNFTTSEAALEVAARENATSQKSIFELQTLVQKIALKEKVQESREFAATVQTALYAGLGRSRGLKNRGVKKAPFVVLIGASMPSVLAEVAFLSNPREEGQLNKPEYRQRIAEALYRGVAQYASALSHFQVAEGPPEGVSSSREGPSRDRAPTRPGYARAPSPGTMPRQQLE
jgi:N-acetylmuramoyl-L-alanine amidase